MSQPTYGGFPAPLPGYPPPQGYNPIPGYGPGPVGPYAPPPGYPPQPGYRPQPGFPPRPGYSQQPPPGYPPRPGTVPPRPPGRKRSPLMWVALAGAAVVVVVIAAFVIVGLSGGSPSAGYQNDDYKVPPPDLNPPALPIPQTEQQVDDWLKQNPFYSQTVPVPVRCEMKPIDVGTASDDLLESHFTGLMECLVRVWQPPVTKAGWQIVRPSVTIYGQDISTKCGNPGVNAFYCSGDQQIYYSDLLPKAFTGVTASKWAADVIMAHEFGHLLQGRTGIFIAGHYREQKAGSKSLQLEFSRRLETQADCFSGEFMRSVSKSLGVQQEDLDGIQKTYAAVGDDTLTKDPNVEGDHGLAKNRIYWGTTGLSSGSVGSCNTFTAPSNLVR